MQRTDPPSPAPNLVARDFTTPAPDRLRFGNLTWAVAREGWRSPAAPDWPATRAMARERRHPGAGLARRADLNCQASATLAAGGKQLSWPAA